MVDRHGVRPDPDAVQAVLTWEAPAWTQSSFVSWDLPIINASSLRDMQTSCTQCGNYCATKGRSSNGMKELSKLLRI